MKFIIPFTTFLLQFFLTVMTLAQSAPPFAEVDDHARSVVLRDQSLEQFTREELLADITDPLLQARAIFVWITENIAYDCHKYHTRNRSFRVSYTSEEDLQRKLSELDKRTISQALKRRRGVCHDYSVLFNAMCAAVGIESRQIDGHVPNGVRIIGKKPGLPNHSWNAFRIGREWHLVDATWGSGFVDAAVTKFRKDFRPAYFMMPPEDLIKTHFPEDSKWQLLDRPLDAKEFSTQPVYHPAYWDLGIQSISPTNGKINASMQQIRLKIPNCSIPGEDFIIVQGEKLVQQGFVREGDYYQVFFTPKGRRQATIMVKSGRRTYDPIVSFDL